MPNSISLPDDQSASGRSFGARERELLEEVLTSGVLTATKGTMVKRLEDNFAVQHQRKTAVATASGSAALHAAVAAIDAEPGDEIITTPITDMGALSCILAQGLIPVFADVDADTGNLLCESVAERRSDRSRGLIMTHLFGRLVDVEGLTELARSSELVTIEDAAQALGARRKAWRAGAAADLSCFSFQQGKQMTSGEGGVVLSDDPTLSRRARLFVHKAWPYGESGPDHEFVAPNYRMNELTGAVALAQFEKLDAMLAARRSAADRFLNGLDAIPGLGLPGAEADEEISWWRLGLLVDDEVIEGGGPALAQRLRGKGIAAAPRYVGKPAFECRVFKEQATFGTSNWPYPSARKDVQSWDTKDFPGVTRFLDRVLVLAINERYENRHIDHLLETLANEVSILAGTPS